MKRDRLKIKQMDKAKILVKKELALGTSNSDIVKKIKNDFPKATSRQIYMLIKGSKNKKIEPKLKPQADIQQIAQSVIDLNKSKLANQVAQEHQATLIKDADKWAKFKAMTLKPFEELLETWTPPEFESIPSSNYGVFSDKVYVVGLSDLHYGNCAKADYMFNRPNWSTQDTVAAVRKYATAITSDVSARSFKFKKAIILSLGDLIHSINGKTTRGTELQYDEVRERQFDFALTSLFEFVSQMLNIFGTVEVHDICGNHYYELDMALWRAIELGFRNDPRVTFKHHQSRPSAFRDGNTLFMIDHGAASVERTYVPNGGKREPHVLNFMCSLFNTHSELLVGAKSRLFIMGDKHHFLSTEYAQFEFIQFSTIQGSDQHAAQLNLYNRPRQSCLILDDYKGLESIIHTYFD